MTLRKMLPATLLLLAACASNTATPAATESVGMDKSAKKDCCATMTAEQKAACQEAQVKPDCCEKDKAPAADAPKVNG